MLIVTARNIGGDDAVADYAWEVRVNDAIIARGVLRRYERKGGWRGLLEAVAGSERRRQLGRRSNRRS